jgi:hypothetical protein
MQLDTLDSFYDLRDLDTRTSCAQQTIFMHVTIGWLRTYITTITEGAFGSFLADVQHAPVVGVACAARQFDTFLSRGGVSSHRLVCACRGELQEVKVVLAVPQPALLRSGRQHQCNKHWRLPAVRR